LIEEPNFENYTIDELQDAYNYIDKVTYPERTKKLKDEIEIRLKTEQLLGEQSFPELLIKPPIITFSKNLLI